MSKYIVWRKDADREDGKQIEADYERQAAEKWAEWRDFEPRDQPITDRRRFPPDRLNRF